MPNDTLDTTVAARFASDTARRLKELREAQGLSIRELARRAQVPPESISRAERELTDVSLRGLAKLCKALMIEVPTFFAFERDVSAQSQRQADVRRLLDALARLDPARRRHAIHGFELLLTLAADGKESTRGSSATRKR